MVDKVVVEADSITFPFRDLSRSSSLSNLDNNIGDDDTALPDSTTRSGSQTSDLSPDLLQGHPIGELLNGVNDGIEDWRDRLFVELNEALQMAEIDIPRWINENEHEGPGAPENMEIEIPNWVAAAGETASPTEALEATQLHQATKPVRRRRMDRSINSNGPVSIPITSASDYVLHNNNNNHVKSERLSPGTPDTSSRSRSVTPSSASHPDTPPASESLLMPTAATGRNYSDFMRSLAAKYNNANPNDYFNAARNGFPPPLDPRFKPSPFPNILPSLAAPQNKENESSHKKADFPVLNPFVGVTGAGIFPPLIDMSTTQTLLAMVRSAKEAELQNLLKNVKRQDTSSPLDLSSAAPPGKKPRMKTSSSSSPVYGNSLATPRRAESESPKLHEDVSNWTIDDVCNFVSNIDICAEYVETFRDQRIDGAGLPLLTEEHLTSTMNMKLGPALKLRSVLAKKLGSCNICLHCTHCHNSSGSPEPTNTSGNMSDSGGAS